MTLVYGQSSTSLRQELSSDFALLNSGISSPWLPFGDINVVLNERLSTVQIG